MPHILGGVVAVGFRIKHDPKTWGDGNIVVELDAIERL